MVVLAVLAVVGGAGPAVAHASLVGSDPADGSTVRTAPRTVTLTFSEDIRTGFIGVTAPDGSAVKTAATRTAGRDVRADLSKSDQRGRYTVAYRVVSADGHPVSGSITFTTTTGRAVTQQSIPEPRSFVDRHGTPIIIGLAFAVVAIGVMLAPLRPGRRE
jgi:copper resistance protein C